MRNRSVSSARFVPNQQRSSSSPILSSGGKFCCGGSGSFFWLATKKFSRCLISHPPDTPENPERKSGAERGGAEKSRNTGWGPQHKRIKGVSATDTVPLWTTHVRRAVAGFGFPLPTDTSWVTSLAAARGDFPSAGLLPTLPNETGAVINETTREPAAPPAPVSVHRQTQPAERPTSSHQREGTTQLEQQA